MPLDSDTFLRELSGSLREVTSSGLATQAELARRAGISQSDVSRFMNGTRKRVTAGTRRLRDEVETLLRMQDRDHHDGTASGLPRQVQAAAADFLNEGGSEQELIAALDHTLRMVNRRFR